MKTLFVKIALVPLCCFLVVTGTVNLWLLKKLVTMGRRMTGCQVTEGQAWIDGIWAKWNFVWEEYSKSRKGIL